MFNVKKESLNIYNYFINKLMGNFSFNPNTLVDYQKYSNFIIITNFI